MQYVKKEKPKNICDLRRRVNRFSENIDEEVLRKMVRHNRKRAVHCIDSLGSHFQQLLQIYVKINKWYAFASILLFTDLKNSDYKYI